MKLKVFIIGLILFTTVCARPHLSIRANRIYDQNGGERIFHGINLVEKVPPYYDQRFGVNDLVALQKNGVNGLRLGVMWPGVEPKKDQFDQSYIDRMVDLVNLAGKYNIYTLVQFHQDLFSEKFCGDGVPLWAIPRQVFQSFPFPVNLHQTTFNNETGLPPSSACSKPWGEYYSSKAVNKGFGHLYKNKGGLLDRFIIYWKKVASAFKGNPFVIAYQLINEPWPGNMYENPLVMVPGLSEQFHLQEVYDKLSVAIRSIDPDHNICFEPVTWLNSLPSGFTHPPGGHRYTNSSIFCYHYYNPPTVGLNGFMKARMADIKRLGGGGLLSEFYVEGQEGIKNSVMMDQCDTHSQSWFGWYYQPNQLEKVKRTFAHRVAGRIVSQSFNKETKEYSLLYHSDSSAGQTSIFVDMNEFYSQSFDVKVYPTLSNAQYSLKNKMYLNFDSKQFENGTLVMITIAP